MRLALVSVLSAYMIVSSGARAETTWTYEEVHDPYENVTSHQAIGGGVRADGGFTAIALICAKGVLAVVMVDDAPLDLFGPVTVRYRFDEAAEATRTWVHGNGQASSYDDAREFAAAVSTHDRLRIRLAAGVERELSLVEAPPHVQRVLTACEE